MSNTSTLEAALRLAKKHFHVFPLPPNKKKKPPTNFENVATQNLEEIKNWWTKKNGLVVPYNIGISTGRYNEKEFLLGLDIDKKNGVDGFDSIFQLTVVDNLPLPETFTQKTPNWGEHLIYRVPFPVGNSAKTLAPGLDTRGLGGYLVGSGSIINGIAYTDNDKEIVDAPDWLIDRCTRAKKRTMVQVPLHIIDMQRAENRAIEYLQTKALPAVQGEGGDQHTYQIAAAVKDFGVDELSALSILLEFWNDRCDPPWSSDELAQKVRHAYQYGKEPIGVKAPEAVFSPITEAEPEKVVELTPEQRHPVEQLNEEFALVLEGSGHNIFWETENALGEFDLRHLREETFHAMFRNHTLTAGGVTKPLSKWWMESKTRRQYSGVCFRPGLEVPKDFYNLWRDFAVKPLPKNEKPSAVAKAALDTYLEHLLENICRGNKLYAEWTLTFFAQLMQEPWKKPHSAIILQGQEGVGKNAFMAPIEKILGVHYQETASERFVKSNFNAHLENKILLTLNEATWAGDKQAESTLKHLITGSTHLIERKNQEPYSVENCIRVVIMGNEDWLVPAGPLARRFFVLEVGEKRRQDTQYFKKLSEGMAQGGYELLLRYLLDYDITKHDLYVPPKTDALLSQKLDTQGPLGKFWRLCLGEGHIVTSDLGQTWPEKRISKDSFYQALRRETDRSIGGRARIPDMRVVGKRLKRMCPSINTHLKLNVGQNKWVNAYQLPDLETARREWCVYMGQDDAFETLDSTTQNGKMDEDGNDDEET